MAEATGEGRLSDLSRMPRRKLWWPATVAVLVVVAAASGFFWVISRSAKEARVPFVWEREGRVVEFTEPPLSLSLALSESCRVVQATNPVRIAVAEGDEEILCGFQLLERERPEEAAALWRQLGDRLAIDASEGRVKVLGARFRWLDPSLRYGAWESLFASEPAGGERPEGSPTLVHHQLFVELPSGVLLITYSLPADGPPQVVDRVETLISSLRWGARE